MIALCFYTGAVLFSTFCQRSSVTRWFLWAFSVQIQLLYRNGVETDSAMKSRSKKECLQNSVQILLWQTLLWQEVEKKPRQHRDIVQSKSVSMWNNALACCLVPEPVTVALSVKQSKMAVQFLNSCHTNIHYYKNSYRCASVYFYKCQNEILTVFECNQQCYISLGRFYFITIVKIIFSFPAESSLLL